MSTPVWAESFEAEAAALLQAAYDHADHDDAIEAILLIGGIDPEGRLSHDVAYRVAGRRVGSDGAPGPERTAADEDRLRADLAETWGRIFALIGDDGITTARLSYDVADQDLRSDFGYDPLTATDLDDWREGEGA